MAAQSAPLAPSALPGAQSDALLATDGDRAPTAAQAIGLARKEKARADAIERATAELHGQLTQGDYRPSRVAKALKAGADPCAVNAEGFDALMLAAQRSMAEAIVMLLGQGADPKATGPGGKTALMIAAENGSESGARLLAPVSDPAQKDNDGQTALEIAIPTPLLSHSSLSARLQTLARLATVCGFGDLSAEKIEKLAILAVRHEAPGLLAACAERVNLATLPDAPENEGGAPAWPLIAIAASGRKNSSVLKILIASGADAQRAGPGGETALMRAARSEQSELGAERVSALLPVSDVNARNERGETALMRARSSGAAKALLAGGADPELKTKGGDTALLVAMKGLAACNGPSAGPYMTALRNLFVLAPVSAASTCGTDGLSATDWAISLAKKTGDWRPLEMLATQMSPKDAMAASFAAVCSLSDAMKASIERAQRSGLRSNRAEQKGETASGWDTDWRAVDQAIKGCVNEWRSWGPLEAMVESMPPHDAFEAALRVVYCAMPALKPRIEARLLEIEIEAAEKMNAARPQNDKTEFAPSSATTNRGGAGQFNKKTARL